LAPERKAEGNFFSVVSQMLNSKRLVNELNSQFPISIEFSQDLIKVYWRGI